MKNRKTNDKKRVSLNATTYAKSNKQTQRYAIGTYYSEDNEDVINKLVSPENLCLVAIVYATSAVRAIARFRKQFTERHLKDIEIEALVYESAEAQHMVKMCLYIYNNSLRKGEVEKSQTVLEDDYSRRNIKYELKASKKRKVIKEKKKVKATSQLKTTVAAQYEAIAVPAEFKDITPAHITAFKTILAELKKKIGK